MKTLMTHFLATLNEQDARFKGNHLFLFEPNADRFVIYENDGSTLVNEDIEYIPVMQTRAEPILYLTKNKRIDWDVEYYIAIKIKGDAYDVDDDPDYQRIETACAGLNRTFGEPVVTYEGKRYVFKASPPKRIGYFMRGADSFAMLSCSMMATEIEDGWYAQDVSIKLDNVELDIVRYTRNMTRRYYTGDEKDTQDNDFNIATGRAMTFSMDVVITDAEMALLKIPRGKASLKACHKLTETFDGDTVEYDVMIRSSETLAQLNHGCRVVLHMVETKLFDMMSLGDEMYGYSLRALFQDKAGGSGFEQAGWQPNGIDVSVSWSIIHGVLRVDMDDTSQSWHVKMDVDCTEGAEIYCYALLKSEDALSLNPLGGIVFDISEARWHIASHKAVALAPEFSIIGTDHKTMDIRLMGYINLTEHGITLTKTELDNALKAFALIALHDRGVQT